MAVLISAGYIGSVASPDTTNFTFNTVDATGLPATFTGGQVVARNLSTDTVSQVGLTLAIDASGNTGMHKVTVDTSDISVWPKNVDYSIEAAAGVVGSISCNGYVVGQLTVSGKSDGRLYDQAVRVHRGTVTAVDGGQPGRVFTASIPNISNTINIFEMQVCSFQPRTDGTGSNNQGTGRAILKTVSAGTDLVTITVQDEFKDPVIVGDQFVILPEERELTIYTANITVEWGFGQSQPDKYSIQWMADGEIIYPASTQDFASAGLEVYKWSDDTPIISVSSTGALQLGANTGVYKYSEPTNVIAPNEGAIMICSALIDGIVYSFSRTLFNYV